MLKIDSIVSVYLNLPIRNELITGKSNLTTNIDVAMTLLDLQIAFADELYSTTAKVGDWVHRLKYALKYYFDDRMFISRVVNNSNFNLRDINGML